MLTKYQLTHFITSFVTGNIACIVTVSLVVWSLFQQYDAVTFTVLTLISLLLNAFVMAKFSYLLDRYSRKTVVLWLNVLMAMCVMLLLLINSSWLYVVMLLVCKFYFGVYYTARNALAQTLNVTRFQRLNATLEVTDQLSSILASGLVVLLFEWLGLRLMLLGAVGVFLFSAWLLAGFSEPSILPSQHNEATVSPRIAACHPEKKGFAWFFSRRIAWLVTLAILPNLVVLQSNTIDPIYLYEVLGKTPETVATLGMAFSIGAMLGGLISGMFNQPKSVIYACFMLSFVMTFVLALFPRVEVFAFAIALFGLSNSASRVAFRSVIMLAIPNHEVATFYGLRGSLVSGLQFMSLLIMSLTLLIMPASVSVWFYPAVFMFLPVLWQLSRVLSTRFLREYGELC